MKDSSTESLSARLRSLTAQLKDLDEELKTQPAPDATALMKFRHVLDNTRMTAWTVNELLNARATRRNPDNVLSFLAAERVRRFGQMVKDLCADLERDGLAWQASVIQGLSKSANLLHNRLSVMTSKSKAPFEKTGNTNGSGKGNGTGHHHDKKIHRILS